MDFIEELTLYIKTSTPLIYVTALETERAVHTIQSLSEDLNSISGCKVWRNTTGWDNDGDSIPNDVPDKINSFESNTVCVLVNFHWYLGGQTADPVRIQQFIDGYYFWKGDKPTTVIIIAPSYSVAPELERLFQSVTYSLPPRERLKEALDAIIEAQEGVVPTPTEEEEVKILDAAGGLTEDEFENAVVISILRDENRKVNAEIVMEEKSKTLTKTGYLDYWPNPEDLTSVGGMDNLKTWLDRRKKALGPEAKAFGLPYPKGIMLLGISGTGKSLLAKCIARTWELPLIKFDLSKVFASLVGQSEQRMRAALAQIEALAPCVTGDTTIILGDGSFITAENLYKESSNKTVMAINENTLETQKVSLITGFRRGIKSIFKIETVAGTLKATDNHKLLTIGGWKEVNELSKDDFIFFPNINVPETKRPLFITLLPEGAQLKKDSLNTWRLGHGGFSDFVLDIPFEITKELGELLGMLDSGGTISDKIIAFHSSNEIATRRFGILIKSLFNISIHTRINFPKGHTSTKKDGTTITNSKDSYTAYFSNKLLSKSLQTLRDNLFEFEYNHLLPAYLRAFINGDGWCGVQDGRYLRFAITQIKTEQRNRIIEALRRIGILGRFIGKNIYISGEGARRLYEKLIQAPSFEGDKLDQLDIPVLNYKHKITRTIRYTEKGAFAKIINIRRNGSAEVYDFSCDGVHSYISNGMVSHNCTVWVDEAEKGLAGAKNTSNTDSGVTKRIFGTLISWMQERPKDKLIYMIMTVNDVLSLPPELLRKGRFDEIFFVDLPNPDEREEIFNIHLEKRGRLTTKLKEALPELVKASDDFSGAEIEVVIEDAMFNIFYEDRDEILPEDLKYSLNSTVPLARTRAEEVEFMRDWSKNRAKMAQSPFKGNINTNLPKRTRRVQL